VEAREPVEAAELSDTDIDRKIAAEIVGEQFEDIEDIENVEDVGDVEDVEDVENVEDVEDVEISSGSVLDEFDADIANDMQEQTG